MASLLLVIRQGRQVRRQKNWSISWLLLVSCVVLNASVASAALSLGREKMAFVNDGLLSYNVSHRQDVCDRYDMFRNNEVELRYALQGLQLRPLIARGDYFHYHYGTEDGNDGGIDAVDPGLMGTLMDALAERAGFTWRESFAVMEPPLNVTWTDMLLWAVDTYDVAVNWWDQSVERMEKGVSYIEPWFDGSVVLIDKADPPIEDGPVNLFNWLRPFSQSVWGLTVVTIILSGIVGQLIEALHDERNDRSMWQWYGDHLYLSWLNFTQNYEYAPNSVSGRLFGVSMGIWALVMTATYTANLASLLVERKQLPPVVDSIDEAVLQGIPICTYANTNADFLIKQNYPNAIRVPNISELEAYKALHRGVCGLVASYKDNWLGYQSDGRYNPYCDLAWVGRTVEVIKSGFAVKADAGYKCTSLIRDVLNLHLTELMADDVLEEAWAQHRSKNAQEYAVDCNTNAEESDDATTNDLRLLRKLSSPPKSDGAGGQRQPQVRRQLKGAGGGNSASANSGDGEGDSLTLRQMAGIFFLHYVIMTVAVLSSLITQYHSARLKETNSISTTKQKSFRSFGPIIGIPPPLNTYVKNHEQNKTTGRKLNVDENNRHSPGTSALPPEQRRPTASFEQHDYYGGGEGDPRWRGAGGQAGASPSSFADYFENVHFDLRATQRSFQRTHEDLKKSQESLQRQQQDMAAQMGQIVLMMQEMRAATAARTGWSQNISGQYPFERQDSSDSHEHYL